MRERWRRPIRAANDEMSRMMGGEAFRRVEVSASGELGDFMRRFNAFVDGASEKIHTLEQEQQNIPHVPEHGKISQDSVILVKQVVKGDEHKESNEEPGEN